MTRLAAMVFLLVLSVASPSHCSTSSCVAWASSTAKSSSVDHAHSCKMMHDDERVRVRFFLSYGIKRADATCSSFCVDGISFVDALWWTEEKATGDVWIICYCACHVNNEPFIWKAIICLQRALLAARSRFLCCSHGPRDSES